MASLRRDDRGVTPVVSKTLAIGLALLYVAGMTTVLFGGIVSDYQTQAGAEMGERVLATVAGQIESAPPTVDGTVETETTISLPPTIRNSGYTLVVSNRTLELEHPDEAIHAKTTLSLPTNVAVENSTFHSGSELVITVEGTADDRTVTIGDER